jgi:hypothetical protein
MNTRENKHQTCSLSEGRQDEELRKKEERKGICLTNVGFGCGSMQPSMLALDMVNLFFETIFVMVLQDALADSRPDWSWGPCRSAVANDGSTRPALMDLPETGGGKRKGGREPTAYSRDYWATDVFL